MENIESVEVLSDSTIKKIKIVKNLIRYSVSTFIFLIILKCADLLVSIKIPTFNFLHGDIASIVSIITASSFFVGLSSLMFLYFLKTGATKMIKILGSLSLFSIALCLFSFYMSIFTIADISLLYFLVFLLTFITTPILLLALFINIAHAHRPASIKRQNDYSEQGAAYSIRPFLISVLLIALTLGLGAFVYYIISHISFSH